MSFTDGIKVPKIPFWQLEYAESFGQSFIWQTELIRSKARMRFRCFIIKHFKRRVITDIKITRVLI